jgi:3-dehydroquinate dehydratase-2
MKLLIVNGPNLNLLGKREPEIYGNESFDAYLSSLREMFQVVEFSYFQSNVEGELINALHGAMNQCDGIIINPGGYSHTSVALADAIASIQLPVIEVHLSNLYKREEFRHISLTARNCIGVISGFGLLSYQLAVEAMLARLAK